MIYNVKFYGDGYWLAGTLEYYDLNDVKLGSSPIGVNGTDVDSSAIPAGTVVYKGVVPGYPPVVIDHDQLAAQNTLTFRKEIPVAKYIAIAGAVLIGGYLANKYLKL